MGMERLEAIICSANLIMLIVMISAIGAAKARSVYSAPSAAFRKTWTKGDD